MRLRALCLGSVLLTAIGFGVAGAVAQETQFEAPALDTKALDTGAPSTAPKAKGKKAKTPSAPVASAPGAAKPAAGGPNRQFGELEGWSPGKEPPKPAEKQRGSAPAQGAGMGMSPSGNMSVGLPF